MFRTAHHVGRDSVFFGTDLRNSTCLPNFIQHCFMRVLGDGGWCKIQVGRSHSPIFIIFWLYYPFFFVFTKWWYACFHLVSPYYKKNYDETWYLYPRIFLPKTHGVRSVSTGFENEDKCTSYVITDRCDACVCDECPVKKPLKSFLLHRLSRKPWH